MVLGYMKKNDEEYKTLWKGTESRYTAEHLRAGETVICVGHGNSMTPILLDKQEVVLEPVGPETELTKKDIVLSKVRGNHYLHMIHAIQGDRFLIGNNHGHMNGWVRREKIYGKVKEVLYD